VTGGGGGTYAYGRRKHRRRLHATVVRKAPTAKRDRSALLSGSPAPQTSSGNLGGGTTTPVNQQRASFTPNKVYTAAAGAVANTVRTQGPAGSRVIQPPPKEAAAGALKPSAISASQMAAVAAAAARAANGTWQTQAAGAVTASGAEAAPWRDVYMTQAYYDPSYLTWAVDFTCRFKANWNVRNTVTLLATIVKVGVITHGSASDQLGSPLGLAYPQVAVRGGTMLVTYTYSSYVNLPSSIPGATTPNVPAFAGGWCVFVCVCVGGGLLNFFSGGDVLLTVLLAWLQRSTSSTSARCRMLLSLTSNNQT